MVAQPPRAESDPDALPEHVRPLLLPRHRHEQHGPPRRSHRPRNRDAGVYDNATSASRDGDDDHDWMATRGSCAGYSTSYDALILGDTLTIGGEVVDRSPLDTSDAPPRLRPAPVRPGRAPSDGE